MRHIVLIAHNLRSTHNVGSLLRTADGLGIERVVLSGYTPYPVMPHDQRLPHLAAKIDKQIAKTALGAEHSVHWQHQPDIEPVISALQHEGYQVVGLEQAETAQQLPDFAPSAKLVIILGREVEGLEPEVAAWCDTLVEIPMFGNKESYNVVQAAAMALYHCRFAP